MRKSYDNYHQSNNRGGDYQNQNQQHHDGGKFEQRMQSLRLDNETRSSKGSSAGGEQQAQSSGPKKMTWATIASQPAKPQVSTISTTIKKKGPGMPPPPIIPGKHSLELNDSWDTPKNGPLVPPSPPVITAPPAIDLLSLEKQNNANYDGQPAWPTIDQAGIQSNVNNLQQGSSQAQQQPSQQHHHQNQPPPSRGYNNQYNNNNNNNNNSSYHRGQYNQNNSASSHYNNHSNYNNDNYKPYHQNPHQMPTAPTTSQNQSSANNEYRERMPRNMHQSSQNQQQPPQQQPEQQQRRHEPAPQVVAISPAAPQISSSAVASISNNDYKKVTDENVLEQLRGKNQYNPSELDLSQVENAR